MARVKTIKKAEQINCLCESKSKTGSGSNCSCRIIRGAWFSTPKLTDIQAKFVTVAKHRKRR